MDSTGESSTSITTSSTSYRTATSSVSLTIPSKQDANNIDLNLLMRQSDDDSVDSETFDYNQIKTESYNFLDNPNFDDDAENNENDIILLASEPYDFNLDHVQDHQSQLQMFKMEPSQSIYDDNVDDRQESLQNNQNENTDEGSDGINEDFVNNSYDETYIPNAVDLGTLHPETVDSAHPGSEALDPGSPGPEAVDAEVVDLASKNTNISLNDEADHLTGVDDFSNKVENMSIDGQENADKGKSKRFFFCIEFKKNMYKIFEISFLAQIVTKREREFDSRYF